jgi:hypothetical protein
MNENNDGRADHPNKFSLLRAWYLFAQRVFVHKQQKLVVGVVCVQTEPPLALGVWFGLCVVTDRTSFAA